LTEGKFVDAKGDDDTANVELDPRHHEPKMIPIIIPIIVSTRNSAGL